MHNCTPNWISLSTFCTFNSSKGEVILVFNREMLVIFSSYIFNSTWVLVDKNQGVRLTLCTRGIFRDGEMVIRRLSAIKSTVFEKREIWKRAEIKAQSYFASTFYASLGNFKFAILINVDLWNSIKRRPRLTSKVQRVKFRSIVSQKMVTRCFKTHIDILLFRNRDRRRANICLL